MLGLFKIINAMLFSTLKITFEEVNLEEAENLFKNYNLETNGLIRQINYNQ